MLILDDNGVVVVFPELETLVRFDAIILDVVDSRLWMLGVILLGRRLMDFSSFFRL